MTDHIDDKDSKSSGGEPKASATRGIARRELLTRLSATGVAVGSVALPASWSRPVVDSVILPAHAQTSFGDGFFGSDFIQVVQATDPDSAPRSILDAVVGQAHAGTASVESSEFFIEGFLSGDSHLILAFSAMATSEALEEAEIDPPIGCEDEVDAILGALATTRRLVCFSGQVNSETPTELSLSSYCLDDLPSPPFPPGPPPPGAGPRVTIVSSSAEAVDIQLEDGPGGNPFVLTLVPGGTAPDCSCFNWDQLIEDVETCNVTSMTETSTFDGHV